MKSINLKNWEILRGPTCSANFCLVELGARLIFLWPSFLPMWKRLEGQSSPKRRVFSTLVIPLAG